MCRSPPKKGLLATTAICRSSTPKPKPVHKDTLVSLRILISTYVMMSYVPVLCVLCIFDSLRDSATQVRTSYHLSDLYSFLETIESIRWKRCLGLSVTALLFLY